MGELVRWVNDGASASFCIPVYLYASSPGGGRGDGKRTLGGDSRQAAEGLDLMIDHAIVARTC